VPSNNELAFFADNGHAVANPTSFLNADSSAATYRWTTVKMRGLRKREGVVGDESTRAKKRVPSNVYLISRGNRASPLHSAPILENDGRLLSIWEIGNVQPSVFSDNHPIPNLHMSC